MDISKLRSYYLRKLLDNSQIDIHPERYLVTEADSPLEEWWCTHATQSPIDMIISDSFTDATARLRHKHWL